MSTFRDSMPAIPSNRHSQVVMRHRLGVQDGEALAEQAGLDEEYIFIELESEPVQQRTTPDSWFDGILEVPRVGALLPTSLDAPVEAPTGTFPQQTGTASTDSRDRELTRLRTQRRLLLALLGSFLGASAAFYLGSIRPESLQQQRLIIQLQDVLGEQHAQHQQQWKGLTSRVSNLDARFSELDSRLDAIRPTAASIPAQTPVMPRGGSTNVATPSIVTKALVAAPIPLIKPTAPEGSKPVQSRAAAGSIEPANAPSAASADPLPSLSPSPDAPPAPVQTESTDRPSLRDAMRAVAVRDSKHPPSSQAVPQRIEKAEPLKFASKCDKADPLCGDLD